VRDDYDPALALRHLEGSPFSAVLGLSSTMILLITCVRYTHYTAREHRGKENAR